MPRKRIKGKKRGGKLNNSQHWNLVLSKSRIIDEMRSPFKSALTRRAAWYEHRHDILANWLDSHPGKRPGAWWSYEAKEQPAHGEEEWETLIRLGVMDETEKAAVLAQWVNLMHLREGFYRGTYDHMKQGIGPFHGSPTWEATCSTYDRQAALLEPMALAEWETIRAKIQSDWEAHGCGGCDYALSNGYCQQKTCKHWRNIFQ